MSSLLPLPIEVLAIGPHKVIRRPIPGTPYYSFTIMDGNTPVLVDMSYPTEELCAEAIRRAHATTPIQSKRGRPARRAITAATRAKRPAA